MAIGEDLGDCVDVEVLSKMLVSIISDSESLDERMSALQGSSRSPRRSQLVHMCMAEKGGLKSKELTGIFALRIV